MTDAATIVRIVCAFGVIALVLYTFALISRRRMGLKLAGGTDRLVRVIETTPLAQNSALHVVRIGERYHVVALSSGTVSLLTEIEPLSVDRILAARATPAPFSLRRRAPLAPQAPSRGSETGSG